MVRTTACALVLALLTACGHLTYDARLGPKVRARVMSQDVVQSKCSAAGVGLPTVLAYSLMVPTFGCTIFYKNGQIEVFSMDDTAVLLGELEHAFSGFRCHDALGRPARCD